MVSRRRFLAASSTAGIAPLAGCQDRFWDETDSDEIDVPYSVITPPGNDAGEPGWVLVSRDEGAFTVTFDMRVCGDVGDVTAAERGDASYALSLTAELDDNGSNCRPSRVLGSFDAPTEEFDLSLTVEVNGEPLEEIEKSGTPTSLYGLPELLTRETIDTRKGD